MSLYGLTRIDPEPTDVRYTDGLYTVTIGDRPASLLVEDGHITKCAPVLRPQVRYWITRARWIAP